MLNGSGLRVVLWCSGCEHHCNNCQNPQTWDFGSGIPFDENAKEEIFSEIKKIILVESHLVVAIHLQQIILKQFCH